MTEEEAHRILGVPLGATWAQIKAAYYAKAKQYYPDSNLDPGAAVAFQQVCEAYRTLRDRPPAQIASFHGSLHDQSIEDPGSDKVSNDTQKRGAARLVRTIMASNNLDILFDGSIRVGTEPRCGYGPDDEQAWLNRPREWDIQRLHDAVMDEVRGSGLEFSASDVKRAVRKVVREDRRGRENAVMQPLLYDRLDAAEQARAAAAWQHLAATLFDMDIALAVAVLKHFIWQVKRKQLKRSVHHHLMPVVVSPEQGGGKTTFVRRFLGPLEELASDPVLLSDFVDGRSGDVLRFPVVFTDDVERLHPRQIPTLKSLITTSAVSRRRLFSSAADKRPQGATLIGTANEPIGRLVADDTGHRRFVELPFRNGAVAKGGDEGVWQAVNETDYGLLWRSVDGHGPSPIMPHLVALAAAQGASAPIDQLRECLVSLDLRCEDVRSITVLGGVGADDLLLLINARLREEMSRNGFSQRMAVLVHDPAVPFGPKKRTQKGMIYPVKRPS